MITILLRWGPVNGSEINYGCVFKESCALKNRKIKEIHMTRTVLAAVWIADVLVFTQWCFHT